MSIDYGLAAQNALRDQRIHAALLAEIQTLRQALWDAGTIIGMDTDGDTTPDHSVNLVESILYEMRAARAAYDEALAPEDATRVTREAARAERERIARDVVALLGDPPNRDALPGSDEKWQGYLLAIDEALAAIRGGEGDAPDPKPCPDCDGTGIGNSAWADGTPDPCWSCGGTGHTPTKETGT